VALFLALKGAALSNPQTYGTAALTTAQLVSITKETGGHSLEAAQFLFLTP
jgi:hypothetical protein